MSRNGVGIFCIENWTSDLRSPSSVRPLLEFLSNSDIGVRYIHQRVTTPGELSIYLDRWSDLDSYEIGFLALHGGPGKVYVGSRDVTVQDLVDRSKPASEDEWRIDLRGKILYFGSCSTLRSKARIEEIAAETGARMVCGYRKDVPWEDSAAFEVMLFSELASFKSPFAAMRRLQKRHGGLIESLGFDWTPKQRR